MSNIQITKNQKSTAGQAPTLNLVSGQAVLIAVVFFMIISMTVVLGFTLPILKQVKIASNLVKSSQSFFLAEAGLEDVTYRLTRGYDVSSLEILSLDGNTAETIVTDISNGHILTTEGDHQSYFRKINSEIRKGEGVSFNYGIQVGEGGLLMSGSSGVFGNVYSNGDIESNGGAFIVGTAVAASSSRISGSSTWNPLRIGSNGEGDAYAYTVDNTMPEGNLYCQQGTGNRNTSWQLIVCDSSLPDPLPQDFPITEEHITDWRAEAEAGGVIQGNVSVGGANTMSLGPTKIEGNLTISGGGTVIMTGALWITGSLNISGGGDGLVLDPSFGEENGILVVDGRTTISNDINGSGHPDSYLLLVSTNDCPYGAGCSSNGAIQVSGSAGAVILSAQEGEIRFTGSSHAKSATAYRIVMTGGTTITYETGIASEEFTTGPSGGWVMVKWREVE